MTTAAEGDSYVLGRSFSESVRLDTQHLLFNLHNGYTIDPKIFIAPDAKIADIGTGTGSDNLHEIYSSLAYQWDSIWLLDVASQVPPTVQLDGFDISDKQFPDKSNLPNNMSLQIMNAFAEVPSEFIGKYDVVHMRLWCCIVRGKNTAPLINHATQLLKPGGYLQWDDGDLSKDCMCIKGAEAEAFYSFSSKILDGFGFDYSWIQDIPNRVKEAGLDVLNFRMAPFSRPCVSIATKTFLMLHFELIEVAYKAGIQPLPPRNEGDALLTALLDAVNGATFHWTPVTLLAQKPAGS